MVCYFISFLDRVNLGFAALQMVDGPPLLGDGIRPRRWHFLRVVLPVRGAEQPASGEVRRPPVDRRDHDHVGTVRRCDGVGHRSTLALSHAVSARGGRSRILSRRDSLSHLLVSRRVPCAHHRVVHGGHSRSPAFSDRRSRRRCSAPTDGSGSADGSGCSSSKPRPPSCSASRAWSSSAMDRRTRRGCQPTSAAGC